MDMELVRLNVNLNQETAAALKSVAAREGITMTEAIRRAIGLLKFVSDERAAGRKIHAMDDDGRNVRELIMM